MHNMVGSSKRHTTADSWSVWFDVRDSCSSFSLWITFSGVVLWRCESLACVPCVLREQSGPRRPTQTKDARLWSDCPFWRHESTHTRTHSPGRRYQVEVATRAVARIDNNPNNSYSSIPAPGTRKKRYVGVVGAVDVLRQGPLLLLGSDATLLHLPKGTTYERTE